MFKTVTKPKKIPVLCDCYKQAINADQPFEHTDCPKCGGKGWHFKSFPCLYVFKHKEKISVIDSNDKGELRFWDYWDSSCYYPQQSLYKDLFWDMESASDYCDRKNKSLYNMIDEIKRSPDFVYLGVQTKDSGRHTSFQFTDKKGKKVTVKENRNLYR